MYLTKNLLITQDRLKLLLNYSPTTGVFTRAFASPQCNVGDIAGTLTTRGYRQISVDNKCYLAHRLAFLYMEGVYPEYVDHRDTNPENNSYLNLRICAQSQNIANASLSVANTTGYKGVSFGRNRGRPYYMAGVRKEEKLVRKVFTISKFPTKEHALSAAVTWVRNTREALHGEFVNHG